MKSKFTKYAMRHHVWKHSDIVDMGPLYLDLFKVTFYGLYMIVPW